MCSVDTQWFVSVEASRVYSLQILLGILRSIENFPSNLKDLSVWSPDSLKLHNLSTKKYMKINVMFCVAQSSQNAF